MTTVIGSLARASAVIAMAVLARLDAWLLVAFGTSIAVLWWRERWWDEHRRRPTRAALVALCLRDRACAPSQSVVELVAAARSPRSLVAEVGVALRRGPELEWARGAEQLARADQILAGLPTQRSRHGDRRMRWPALVPGASATALAAVGLATVDWSWLPAVFVVSFTATALLLTELCDHRTSVQLLAWHAMHRDFLGGVAGAEGATGLALVESSSAVLARAIRIVGRADVPREDRDLAIGVLERARASLPAEPSVGRKLRAHVPEALAGAVGLIVLW